MFYEKVQQYVKIVPDIFLKNTKNNTDLCSEGKFFKEEIYMMKMKSIWTGIGIGMAVGGATAYMKGAMMGSGAKRSMKRTIKNVEGIVGDIRYMFK